MPEMVGNYWMYSNEEVKEAWERFTNVYENVSDVTADQFIEFLQNKKLR